MSKSVGLETGHQFMKTKQYHEAEKFYVNIIKTILENGVNSNIKDEDLVKAYNDLGFVLYKQVRFEESLEKYVRALELDEKFAPSYYNRGTIHYRLGGFDLALQDMKKAVELEPSNSEFILGLQACQDQVTKSEIENSDVSAQGSS